MNIEIDGSGIHSEEAFHTAIASELNLPSHYGKNLDALFDVLSTDVERPLIFAWKNSSISRAAIGERFDLIIDVLRKVERQDVEWGLPEKFELRLS